MRKVLWLVLIALVVAVAVGTRRRVAEKVRPSRVTLIVTDGDASRVHLPILIEPAINGIGRYLPNPRNRACVIFFAKAAFAIPKKTLTYKIWSSSKARAKDIFLPSFVEAD